MPNDILGVEEREAVEYVRGRRGSVAFVAIIDRLCAAMKAMECTASPTEAEIEAVRERWECPDPDRVLDIEALYDDASADRATMLCAYDAVCRENADLKREVKP